MAKNIGVRFAKNGPSIPIELLQALEEGQLVIFCGAGVSRQCGLPDFKGLVECVCNQLRREMEPDERQLFDDSAFDAALGLIENRIEKSRFRKAVRDVLKLNPGSDFSTHQALLQLALTKTGCLRLVTTNFDTAFELCQFAGQRAIDYAPYLPQLGRNWNSVVHLHGGFGNSQDHENEFLVLTSADFGRAYITEGWASRFLSELFRRTRAVLFVGYSISDPAIRYVVDAFAADQPHAARAFILASSRPNETLQHERTWSSRGIEPIIYDSADSHRALHETIQNCAKRYRRGFFDRDSIVLEYGSKEPLAGLEEVAISQIRWALQEQSGHAARSFAKLDPPPSLGWLPILEQAGLLGLPVETQCALRVVGPSAVIDVMPAPHPVVEALCGWLCRHLDSKQLLQWTIKAGCHLHPSFARLVRKRLADQSAAQLPKGVRLIWTFLSAEAAPVYNRAAGDAVLDNLNRLTVDTWNPLLRNLVFSWLAPTIKFSGRSWDGGPEGTAVDLESVNSYAHVELMPASGESVMDLADRLFNRPDADLVAEELLGHLTVILRTGLSYLQFLKQVSGDYDWTSIYRPSIDDHLQNAQFFHWTAYIQLLRQAWERVAAMDEARAREEVSQWMRIQFPLFRRFVLWSAGRPGGLSGPESVEFLVRQPPSCLWERDTLRELLQCFARIAPQLSQDDAAPLIESILKGPPKSGDPARTTDEQDTEIRSRAIYLRLGKLRDGGLILPTDAQQRMRETLEAHAAWGRPLTEQDEFPGWFGSAVSPYDEEPHLNDYETWPDERVILEIQGSPTDPQVVARWRGLCIADAQRAVRILDALGMHHCLDEGIWALGLEHASSEQTRPDCIRLFAAFGNELGHDFISKHLQHLTATVMLYCQEGARVQEESLWPLWNLLLGPALENDREEGADLVFTALNSPAGHLTQALLSRLGALSPKTYEEIPRPMQERLEELLTGSRPAHPAARVLLARALAWLFRINTDLVARSFLPLFDWDSSAEAPGVWSGYLMSPHMTPELWLAIRPLLLKLFPHSNELGHAELPAYSLFAFLLLREDLPLDVLAARHALTVGSPAGRAQVAWYWWRQADSNTDYGAALFRDRLRNLLANVWPLEVHLREEASSKNLADLALCCGAEFENAVRTIMPLLTKITDPHMFLFLLNQKDCADGYPSATLDLLDSLIGDQITPGAARDIRNLLTRISVAQCDLNDNPRFLRLDDLARRFG